MKINREFSMKTIRIVTRELEPVSRSGICFPLLLTLVFKRSLVLSNKSNFHSNFHAV